jgi:hypothetical protein
MILRNKSESVVTIRTYQGFKKIAPKETLELPDNSLLTAIHPCLEVVKDGEIIEKIPVKSKKAKDVVKDEQVAEQQDDSQDNNEQQGEQQKEDEQEAPLTDKEQTVLSVQEIPTEKLLSELEEKINALQKNWEITTRPKKKEQLQKEIQAIRAQIDRLKESN